MVGVFRKSDHLKCVQNHVYTHHCRYDIKWHAFGIGPLVYRTVKSMVMYGITQKSDVHTVIKLSICSIFLSMCNSIFCVLHQTTLVMKRDYLPQWYKYFMLFHYKVTGSESQLSKTWYLWINFHDICYNAVIMLQVGTLA